MSLIETQKLQRIEDKKIKINLEINKLEDKISILCKSVDLIELKEEYYNVTNKDPDYFDQHDIQKSLKFDNEDELIFNNIPNMNFDLINEGILDIYQPITDLEIKYWLDAIQETITNMKNDIKKSRINTNVKTLVYELEGESKPL